MAKKLYVSPAGTARKVTKGYVSPAGIARKIKKGYVGIGGKARPFWAGGELVYYGQVLTGQSGGSDYSASSDTYAIFQGEDAGLAVDKNLLPTTLSGFGVTECMNCAGASNGKDTLFGGGYDNGLDVDYSMVKRYSANLVESFVSDLSNECGEAAAAGFKNGYILFAGGSAHDGTNAYFDEVDAYDTYLVHKTATVLSEAKDSFVGGTVGEYIVFAGGYRQVKACSSVDAYSMTLVKKHQHLWGQEDVIYAAANAGAYLLFCGGYQHSDSVSLNTVDVYNKDLVKLTNLALKKERDEAFGASIDEFAVIGAGRVRNGSGYGSTLTVEMFNSELMRFDMQNVVDNGYGVKLATSVGNYLICDGGDYTAYVLI